VGTMNLFVHLKSGVVTPPTEGTILAGVTRESCLALLNEWGLPAEERRISIDELEAAAGRGELLEIFGTGTAAVIAQVGEVAWSEPDGTEHRVRPTGGPIADRLLGALSALHRGEAQDTRGWLTAV